MSIRAGETPAPRAILHDDGKHEGHGTSVADKGADHTGGEHEQNEEFGFAGSGQSENTGAHALG